MSSVIEYCNSIISIAQDQASRGAHYLWGATGATPGGDEGILLRRGSVSLVAPQRTDPANPAVFAAQCSVDGLHVCAGRFDAANGGIEGGRAANPWDQDLVDYLAGLNNISQDEWQPYYYYFTPRMVEGRTVTRQLVWGEDCRSKQHFDCVGFINYCVEQALGRTRPIMYDIPQWSQDLSGTTAVALDAPPHPADILIIASNGHFKHIGFLTGEGTVVQAEQTTTGVVVRSYNPSGWTYRRRLTGALLH